MHRIGFFDRYQGTVVKYALERKIYINNLGNCILIKGRNMRSVAFPI